MSIRFAENQHVVQLKAPAATTTDTESTYWHWENVQWISFLIGVGAITPSTAQITIYVKTTTGTSSTAAGDTAIPFWYRKSAAVGSDDWGTITHVSTGSDGMTISGDEDNMLFQIDVDPSVIPALDSDAINGYLDIDYTADGTTDDVYALYAIAFIEDRYPMNEHISATT